MSGREPEPQHARRGDDERSAELPSSRSSAAKKRPNVETVGSTGVLEPNVAAALADLLPTDPLERL